MKVLVIGLGGVTNGGKTTLAEKLKKMLPNCDIICQDDFFKPESEVETDERGFKLYDVLDALYMDEMVKSIRNWMKSPASSGVVTEEPQNACDNLKNTDVVYILIVEGFLLYNYEPLNELWSRRYFLTLPYEECKRRRSTRVYQPADTPGYFDGHVWPMYLKYKSELEENASNIGMVSLILNLENAEVWRLHSYHWAVGWFFLNGTKFSLFLWHLDSKFRSFAILFFKSIWELDFF
ncbi:nicotinamide riboside kinase 1 isoform X1 [Pezoporus occidentalis]|uniref:nicotinamide riboside kinase 1 isoform X1 n=1 Tax=Pezoporus occidentalis TaxID=407982 RepID=UPI002F90759E